MDYIYDPYSGELYHYGIKGMKWGVRRFQDKSGRLTAAGKERYSEDESKERKGLTEKQKKAIKIGAAVVATGLAVYGGYKVHQLYTGSGQDVDPITGFRFIKKEMSDADNLLAVNPGRARFLSKTKHLEIIDGSSTNCMLCTNAYELRRRGYDVHAGLEKTGRGFLPDNLFPKLYSDYKGTTKLWHPIDDSGPDMMTRVMDFATKEGPGARGNIVVWWQQGGGHSMIWENVDGKVVFKDGQTNQVYKDFAKTILKNASETRPVEMLRTDNLTLNTAEMKKFVNSDTVLKTYVDHGSEIVKNVADEPIVQSLAMNTAFAGGAYGLYKVNTKYAINQYRKLHPNSTMTDKEIIKMLKEANKK